VTPTHREPEPAASAPAKWYKLAGAAFLLSYFVWVSRSTLWAHFAPDDPMNLAYYWRLPLWQQILGPLMPWKPFYRPLAGWFLMPVLHVFGMNPVAFRAGLLAILLVNAFLLYRLSKRLGCGERAAWLVALVACYHAGLSNLYYNIAFVFDVLCGFFFVCALLYYVGIRERAAIPSLRQVALFLALYLAALGSKEMAVTLPAVLLLYEWFYHPPIPWRPKELSRWVRGPGRSFVASACLTLVCVGSRVLGNGGLIHDAGYVPKLSMARVWAFQLRAFSDMLEKWEFFGRGGIVAIWVVMFYLAWRRPRPVLRFACLSLLITPLPIEFLIGRAEGCLYIPAMALAMFVTVVFVDTADSAARVLAHEPGFRRLPPTRLSALLVAAGALWWAYHNADLKRRHVDPVTRDISPVTWDAIQQLKALRPNIRPRSSVVILNDPFGSWDMLFLAELQIRDRTVDIRLNRKTPLTPEEVAKADYVFDYRDGRFVQVR
jgi:hypothetical protein